MLSKYPPMGWNSWDCYGTTVTEAIVRQNALYMAEHLKHYGWEYVVVDIQWYHADSEGFDYKPFSAPVMDAWGRCIPAAELFPSAGGGMGFKPLADFVHGLGLKFGIHIMRGIPRMAAHLHLPIAESGYRCDQAADPNSICQWNPDMYGAKQDHAAARAYYESIFRLYASWGVDFVKCDDIAREYPHCRWEIEMISRACRNCGREIVLSLSPGPAPLSEAEHLKTWSNMWRITDDFWDDWTLLKGMFERAEKWCIHAGPGHWPDADMLPFGAVRQCGAALPPDRWTKFTRDEQRTLMTLWCMMRSPLMMGGELTKCDAFTLSLLTNAGVLEIQKQSFCAHPLRTTDTEAVWIAPRKDGRGTYIAVFNLSDEERRITVLPEETETAAGHAVELWTGDSYRTLSADLRPHACAVWLAETVS